MEFFQNSHLSSYQDTIAKCIYNQVKAELLNDSNKTTDISPIESSLAHENREKKIKVESSEFVTLENANRQREFDAQIKKPLEKVAPPRNDVMHGEPYTAPPFNDNRPGSMNFMKVNSFGSRC